MSAIRERPRTVPCHASRIRYNRAVHADRVLCNGSLPDRDAFLNGTRDAGCLFSLETAMPTFTDLTYFDRAIALIFLFFLARGLWIGCVRQLAALFALIGGYFCASQYGDRILPLSAPFVDHPKVIFLACFAVSSLVAVGGFTLVGKVLRRVRRIARRGWLDRLTGMVVGGIKAAMVTSLLYMLLTSSLSATNELLRTSFSSPYLRQGAEVLRSSIVDSRLRDAFAQKEPAILPELPPGKDQEEPVER